MSVTIERLERVFVLNGHHYNDPNPELDPKDALNQLGGSNPELNNSSLGKSKMKGNILTYEIIQNFGNKG